VSEPASRRVIFRHFSVPKMGNGVEENEDALRLSEDRQMVAIADGATEGTYSRAWANFLVERFISDPFFSIESQETTPIMLRDWIDRSLVEWQVKISERTTATDAPWFVARAAERGSFATLLAARFVEIERDDCQAGGSNEIALLYAVSIGDTCAFLIRNNRLLASFPLTTPSEFLRHPQLISTVPAQNESAAESASLLRIDVHGGDVIVFMTDALACWFLENTERQRKLDELNSGSGPGQKGNGDAVGVLALFASTRDTILHARAFEDLIAQERQAGTIRNDDCTVVSLTFPSMDSVGTVV
jgi:hypothetical protein